MLTDFESWIEISFGGNDELIENFEMTKRCNFVDNKERESIFKKKITDFQSEDHVFPVFSNDDNDNNINNILI